MNRKLSSVSNKDIETMYQELLGMINQVKNPYFHQLLLAFFFFFSGFVKTFK